MFSRSSVKCCFSSSTISVITLVMKVIVMMVSCEQRACLVLSIEGVIKT